ncbi:hypothetical protein M3Y94_00690000 [Aphelenchoides besseyi]|nr:hypothetical protein M3Y94_00690000 [Aphelenchoides besseyi]KAI6231514.1 hypothetical protein M3Y95_00389700 [Aphelenchoides besseyi]
MSHVRRPQVSHLWFTLAFAFFVFVLVILVHQIMHLVLLNQEELEIYRSNRWSRRSFGQRGYRSQQPVHMDADIKMHEASEVFGDLISEIEVEPNSRFATGKKKRINESKSNRNTSIGPLKSRRSVRPLSALYSIDPPSSTVKSFEPEAEELVEEMDIIYDVDEDVYDDGLDDLEHNTEQPKDEKKKVEKELKNTRSLVNRMITIG